MATPYQDPAPPGLPPGPPPPSVPEGWKAEWSPQHNNWYYVNLSTHISQWHNPLGQFQQTFPPPNQGASFAPQQYVPSQEQGGSISQQNTIPLSQGGQNIRQGEPNAIQQDGTVADGGKGLGKVGGGLIGAAAGLLAGALHQVNEHKTNKSKLKFWGNSNNQTPNNQNPSNAGVGGFLQGIGSHIPFSNNSDPRLYIHGAAFADKDITQGIRGMVTPNQSLEVNTNSLVSLYGDPWPGNDHKQFSVLYSYGERPWELIACSETDGVVSIIPHQPLDKTRMEFVNPDPNSRVISIVWGRGNGLQGGKGTTAKVQELETSGECQATNDWMGFDGMCGPPKTAVVYYRVNGGVGIAGAREQGTCRLPWNPLAKWT